MRAERERDWENIIYQVILIWSWPVICIVILVGKYMGWC